jgi:uncharacterized protein (TIGR03437 family)
MSVSRGFFLKRLFSNSNKLTKRHQLIASVLLLFGLLSAFTLNWSGLAALRTKGEKDKKSSTSVKPLNALTTRGPVLSAMGSAATLVPFQGCTLDCNATVPATGQANVAVSFQGSATPGGCAAAPVYDWNFGDGTPHSNQQNPTHTYAIAGTYTWTLTTSVDTGTMMIDTVVGGVGEGNPALMAPFGAPIAIARDPQGRGMYVVGEIGGVTVIRFINTSASPVTLAGRTIAPGAVRAIAGGGQDLGENAPASQVDLGVVTGLAVNGSGDLVYFANQIDDQVRAVNVSAGTLTVGSASVGAGRVGTLASGFDNKLSGIAVNTSTGDVYAIDAAAGVNKVFKITPGGVKSLFAGNGATTSPSDGFSPALAVNVPLLSPQAIEVDSSGNVFIADTGHYRVIQVDGFGNASLVHQFTTGSSSPNPFPSGLIFQGGNLYSANGNRQTITRLTGPSTSTTVAGISGTICDYTISNCGDGGLGVSAGLNLLGSSFSTPVAGIESDGSGLYILDQAPAGRGRVRYLNLSGASVTISGVTIPAGGIDTIAGDGLTPPYDGGLATAASLSTPVGVTLDGNGNLWVADTISQKIRFVNRGASSVTIFPGTPSAQTVPAGGIVTVNKNVGSGPSDGVPAIQAGFDTPQGLFATGQGIFVVDSKGGPTVPPMTINAPDTSLIRFINTTAGDMTFFPGSGSPITVPAGNIATIAGGETVPIGNGDNGFALNAVFIGASDVVVAPNGTIYTTEVGKKAVRKIDPNTGVVTSLGLTQAQYTGLGLDAGGRLHIADYDGNRVLRENSAGSGIFSILASGLSKPRDVAVASDGTAYVTVAPPPRQAGNHQIVRVSSTGQTSVIAGGGAGFGGDGGLAAGSQLNINPSELVVAAGAQFQLQQTVNIIVGPGGDIFFTDSNNNRVRRISPALAVCTKTGTINIQGTNPLPQITSITPNSASQGSGSVMLTVNGSNFVTASVVRWNGQDRTTTYMSSSQLTASIPATDIAVAGNVSVTVFSPAPGGGTSNAVNFTVTPPNPVPQITSISPNQALEGSAGFTLTVNGTGFVSTSLVRFDGQDRPTTFVSAQQLTAQIPATDVAVAGAANVTVFSPTPGGGVSNPAAFTITAGVNPAPSLTNINPNAAPAGGPSFVMTATGTNFAGTTKLRVNGVDRDTTVINSTQLQAIIPASDITSAGTKQITVFTPAPGGGLSAAQNLMINTAVASVSAASFLGETIAPDSIVAAFGLNLATGVQLASSLPLPTNLLGTVVKVRDSAGTERDASLFFVAPQQINYLVPKDTTLGTATVTVINNGNVAGVGQMQIGRIAPGMFSANSSGNGVAAAVALRLVGSAQIYESIVQFNQGLFVPVPVDLGPESDQVYLILYGTGFRSNNGLANVSVRVGGMSVPVLYAGLAPGLEGADQCNIGPLPRTLIGRGVTDIVMTVEGNNANTVQITIK